MFKHLDVYGLIIFISYILLIIVVGIFATFKKNNSKRDYFLANDELPWWMIGGSILASNISTHQIVGVMAVAYTRGFVATVVEWGAILIGFNALLWIFLPFYLRNGFYTMPEYLEKRFGNNVRAIYTILVIFTYVFVEIGAVLFLGAISLHGLLGISMVNSILIIGVFTGIYTILGGLRAVVWTEMLQVIILIVGMAILSIVTISHAGGFSALMETSKDWKMFLPANDPDFPWTQYLGGTLCISIFYNSTNQFIVQRTLGAKNEWHARMGVIFAQYLKFITPFLIIAPALIAPKIFPNIEKPDLLFVTLVENLLSPGLVGLIMAALIAAVMSHLSGTINASSTILAMDIYKPFFQKDPSDENLVRFGKISGAFIVIFGILCAIILIFFSEKPIFLYILNAYGYFTPGIATIFLMGIFWKKTTKAGAMTAGLLTIPISILLEFFFPHMPFLNRTGIVFWICMFICYLVSLRTKPQSENSLRGLIWNKESLQLPENERINLKGIKNPIVWWTIITIIVLFFFIRYA